MTDRVESMQIDLDELVALRQRVKDGEEIRKATILDLESCMAELATLKESHNEASTLFADCVAGQAELRKKLKGITAFNPNNAASNVQSGARQQGEPVATARVGNGTFYVTCKPAQLEKLGFDLCEYQDIALYTSAPTIPEGYVLLSRNQHAEVVECLHDMAIGKGGWDWEAVYQEHRAILDAPPKTKEKTE